MKTIIRAKESDAQLIAGLAREIWTQHYAGLLAKPQLEYMLEKFQSYEVVLKGLSTGETVYFLMLEDNTPAGYCGVSLEEKEIYLSKIYIRSEYRKHGFGRMMLEHLQETFPDKESIYLNVDRRNEGSVAAYKRLGFTVQESIMRDIGGGYTLDDYVMRRPLMNG